MGAVRAKWDGKRDMVWLISREGVRGGEAGDLCMYVYNMYVIYYANSRLWEKLRSVPFFLFCP